MKITRQFTKAGQDVFSTTEWTIRSSRITNPDGSVVFKMDDAEVPAGWSQLATDIMVSKYFRKAGVPVDGGPNGIATPGADLSASADGSAKFGPEKSVKQVVHRLAGCWRHWGETHGYFDTKEDAQAFYDELCYMLIHQVAAPNSPQWFNTGLHWAYGINGPAQGHWIADPKTGEVSLAKDSYSHPQPHACFIQSVSDDLVNEGGIMDLWVREARLFKYGSGTGTNFSHLRGEGEKLSGGGKSSGLMSWLKIGDRAASAIKSGGTTRRAAKMVCLDMDHPDIGEFINWKVREEIKVAALVEGYKAIKKHSPDMKATGEKMKLELNYDFNGEAYATVSGQNSNNSVRIPDAFFEAVDGNADWNTTWRTSGKVARTFKARQLWDDIAYAAWRCADPGVQFDSTINAWHTCPEGGRINASNPCSEYMFLDNTACNLASINLITLYDSKTRAFDIARYEHAIDLWTIVLEISVLMAAFPSREIAHLSWAYRTLGLGYANLGALLMQAGLAYDSEEARALAGCFSAVLTGRSYRQSALLAKEHGAFAGYDGTHGLKANKSHMLRVIRNHRRAARGLSRNSTEWEGLNPLTRPVPIDHAVMKSGRVLIANAPALLDRSVAVWDEALSLGEKHGYRNAQTTVIAPTGTIGLLMDCDTTGVEPDFALVKFKKLAGGGYFKIANASVKPALEALGYSAPQIKDMMVYLLGTLSVDTPVPGTNVSLKAKLIGAGLSDADIAKINDALPGVFELGFAFASWALGDETLTRIGAAAAAKADASWNLLKHIGLTAAQIDGLNDAICGRQTLEGAPHLKDEHLSVFDCANRCGKHGQRFIRPEGHIRMMGAVQPFISGAISKTINLPTEASVQDCKDSYRLSWELGLKANALYRDGCKLSQPLSTSVEKKEDESEVKAEAAPAPAAVGEPVAREVVKVVERPMRRRLPDTRASITHKFNVAGHEGYLTVGLYEDGTPGELFITMAKEGSTIGGLMDAVGTATSVSLQYGVPVESLVKKFTHQRFEPAGMTMNPDIPFAKSLVDYIFRWLGMQFIPGYREANAPARQDSGPVVITAAASLPELLGMDPPKNTEDAATAATGELFAGEKKNGQGHDGGAHTHVHMQRTVTTTTVDVETTGAAPGPRVTALATAMASQGDGPPCGTCGTITVRNGTCHKCLNCGASQGCS
jgi:ribonucleoside-diphosphate reductase alpha chain